MDLSKKFSNKKVFITGHTGFKGAWLSIWLDLLGAEVTGYALKPEVPSLYKMIAPGLRRHRSVISDIRNTGRLQKEIMAFQPDYIIHMAAQPLVRESYSIPLQTFEINAMGTAYLLESVRSLEKKCNIVVVTTDKVYRNKETGKPFKESDPLGGHDPYSASKAAAEIIAESYRLSFFHPDDYKKHKKIISTARAGNVIGGGDFAKDRIVPDMVKAFEAGKKLVIRNPHAVRPWQHVLEPLSGYLALAASDDKLNTSFNFGPVLKDCMPVEALVKMATSHWQGSSYANASNEKDLHEAGLLKLDAAKAANELMWKPKWPASKAIRQTITWYKEAAAKSSKAYELCVRDINEYIKE